MRRRIPSALMGALARALTGAVLVLALSGCGVVRTVPPSAAPGSPASSGPEAAPFVASEEDSTQTVPVAGKVEPDPSGAYLGVYTPPAPFTLNALDKYEMSSGRSVSIVMWYQPWAPNNRLEFDAAACLAIMRRGAVPMITWEPWDPGDDANMVVDPSNQPKYSLAEIESGYFDDYIRDWARQIKRLGGPVMLRPLHEMNGTWYPWGGTVNGNTPAQYLAAWRRIHTIFETEGATNVTWVWSVNASSQPSTPENSYAAYYPGDEFVDWTAISGFNWGTADPKKSGWVTWRREYAAPLAYLATLPKPICLSEMGCVEQGGDKAAWLVDAYAQIARNPQIGAVVYFDSLEKRPADTEDWRIASTPESLRAFQSAIDSPHFVSTPPAALSDWASKLEGADWTYLGGLIPMY